MADNVTIDPRYSKYTNKEIEHILDSVAEFDNKPTLESDKPVKSGGVAAAINEVAENLPMASEENVRDIVRNYQPEQQLNG